MKVKIILLVALCILCLIMSGCDDGRKAEYKNSYGVKYRFCPNCGAKMEGDNT